MVILTQPAALSLSGNIEKFRISTVEDVSFVLSTGNKEILSAVYTPGSGKQISIDIREIVESQLSFTLKDQKTAYAQSSIFADFTAKINDTTLSFRVIRAGVDRLSTSALNFVTANFLTWQPQIKRVTYYTPEFLTYYATVASNLKVRAYFSDDKGKVTTEEKTLCTMLAGTAYTIPVQYAVICGLYNSKLPAFYDVWVEDTSHNRLTYIQRYVADNLKSEEEQWILFENSLGGIDTFRAYGQTDFTGNHTHNIAEIDDISQEYRVDTERTFQKSTGYLDKNQRKWLLDFFPAQVKYIYLGNYLRPIVVTEDDTTYTDKELPSEYKFTYKYADARPYLNLPRADRLPDELEIYVPELGSFTIPPRLVEFPSQSLSEGVLFPVQQPYSESWTTTTVGAILNYVMNRITIDYNGSGGIGHSHINLDLLQLLSYVDEYLLINGQKIKSGYADDLNPEGPGLKRLIRKDQSDFTNFLLKLLGGAEVGESIDSMLAGKGTILTSNGRIQTDRLEVRGSMTVMDLIINELHAMAGEFNFSDCGKIEKVEFISEGTYRLVMEKSTETDFTNFDEGDVLYSIVNNLRTGGTDYYTSWFRCLARNVNDNAVTVVLYPGSEVPGGKNYPPVAGYNVTRRGNSLLPEGDGVNLRAQSWLLSSREGRMMFLANVYKPLLEDYNYALTIGKLPDIKALENLPVSTDDVGIVAQTVIAEKIYQFDWNGDVVPAKVDRGEWSLAVAQGSRPYRFVQHVREYPDGVHKYTQLEQHTVYRHGCKWGCLIDKTQEEPMWNSPGWQMLEGDTNYHLDFESSNGWQFFSRQVETDIAAVVSYGNRDITNVLMASAGVEVEWLRDTGNVPSDNTWKPTHVDGQRHVIRLCLADMGSEWGISVRKVKFTCRVFIPVGEGFETVENYVGLKI